MADRQKYENYLGDAQFIKYGIVISSLVWEKSYSHIAEAFGITKPYVSQILKRWKDEDQFADRRKSNGGSNKKFTQSKRKSMLGLIEDDRGTSIQNLASEIRNKCNVKVGITTVYDALKSMGFVKSLPVKVPYLSPNAIKKRLEYATRHLEDQFSNVCFTDEAMFQLGENRQLFWWNPDWEDKPVFEDHYNKSKVMIWGGISRRGATQLYYWKVSKDLKVDAFEYTTCLDEVLIDRMDALFGYKKWRLMHDNARPHTAYHTQDFLIDHNIRALDHPPYSPDLNPIELVWAYLKKKVMTQVYKNIEEVLDKIIEEWEKISIDMLNNLIDGHCARVAEVYELKGAFSK